MNRNGHVTPMDSNDDCGFRLFNTERIDLPLLVSVPHAGRDYPAELHDNLRIPAAELLRLEDRYADRLVAPAMAAGIPTIIAHRARAWMDLNRGVDELDPEMVSGAIGAPKSPGSAKMRGGLGLVPRRLAHSGDIWKQRFPADEISQRIANYHTPYHQTVGQCLSGMATRFGSALLVDIHSMPPLATAGTHPAPRIVIGDRFGQSAASIYSEMLLERLKQTGITAALNHPYPGDYILRRHGNARKNIHAIQIEVDRSLYLDSELREPGDGMETTAALVVDLLMLLADLLGGLPLPLAAE